MSEDKFEKIDAGSDFLYAEDFLQDGEWRSYSMTIAAVYQKDTQKTKDGKTIDKYIVEFAGSGKKLALSKTNMRLAKIVIGSNKVSDWVGKKLTLFAAEGVPAFGQKTTAIRVRVPEDMVPYGIRKFMGKDLTGKRIGE